MRFVGAKLLLQHGDCLLAMLRDDFDQIPFPAHWDLPGGGAEPGETPVDCALRELAEEFGLRLTPERLTGHRFPSTQALGQDSWLFHGQITEAEIAAIRFGDEGQGWQMMPVAEYLAHPMAVPQFKPRICRVLGLPAPQQD